MLPKLKRKDFASLKASSSRFRGRYFIFLFSQSDETRVGFIVSRRNGSAVMRNLQKRWIRSFLAEQKRIGDVLPRVKLLVIAIPGEGGHTSKQKDFLKCWKKLKQEILGGPEGVS